MSPLFVMILEAFDQRILDIYLEKVDEIMTKENVTRPFEMQELDLNAELSKDWKFSLKYGFNFFHAGISPYPPRITCGTCHKIPNSTLAAVERNSADFDRKNMKEYPPGNFSIFAGILYFTPNGGCIVVGGFWGDNVDNAREVSMKMWHKKLRNQVRYGGVHYWLGESISQSVVEAGAYTPEYMQFFRDMKKTVDPNYLLSPNKFHLYSYDYDYTKHIVKDE